MYMQAMGGGGGGGWVGSVLGGMLSTRGSTWSTLGATMGYPEYIESIQQSTLFRTMILVSLSILRNPQCTQDSPHTV